MLYFKTSYVTVYPTWSSIVKASHKKFQNIVCYCLSEWTPLDKEAVFISKHRMLLFITKLIFPTLDTTPFQNIVCYCLSKSSPGKGFSWWISKHRMLLFIGQRNDINDLYDNFKTSYVTVYPMPSTKEKEN